MGRNVVVCCDGTNNQFSENNTNVVRLYQFLDLPARGGVGVSIEDADQIAFYDAGVGTFDYRGRDQNAEWRKLVGMATGKGIRQNICEAYRFLMDWYRPGDKVFLFGFSRGAYTVRALSGMIGKVGLLTEGNLGLIDYAYDMYKYQDNEDLKAGFKETYSRDCPIEMVGVWDTVATIIQVHAPTTSSAKVVSTETFSDRAMSSAVRAGYQACALDENRTQFKLSLWDEHAKRAGQTIEQVWFAGVHSDVGGFWRDRSLSDITLEWMMEKASDLHGLGFRSGWRSELTKDPLGPQHDTRTAKWVLTDALNWFRPDSRFPPHSPLDTYSASGKYKVHSSVRTRAGSPTVPHLDTAEKPTRRQYRQDLLKRSDIDWV